MASKKRSSAYWKRRFELIEQAQHKTGAQAYAEIETQYRQAQRRIESQINAWYGRFATNNGVTLADAKRMLDAKQLAELKWDVQDYIRYGQQNAINGQWVKELENASARFHISRLEALKLQTQQSLEVMFGDQLDTLDQTMRDVYKSGYYRTAYEIQRGCGVGWDFATLDDATISKVINKPWAADGANFSARVWNNRQKLVNELNQTLTKNIVLGQDPQKAIDAIAKKLNTSKANAGRLVMTEEAFFSSAAQKDCFNELDVEQYEIVATLDSHTSEICQDMDGKHFPMSQWEVGVTAPPFHVCCRTITVPYFDDDFDLVGKRAARGEDGKTYQVPANMTYKEWKEKFVDSGDKSGLNEVEPDDTIKVDESEGDAQQAVKDKLTKLEGSMPTDDFAEYTNLLQNHPNTDIRGLYEKYGDKPSTIIKTANGGQYSPSTKTLKYDMPTQNQVDNGISKFSTVAHEYGHAFDDLGTFKGLNYTEVDTLNSHVVIGSGQIKAFKRVPSSSDEFLTALRKDRDELAKTFGTIKSDLLSTYASAGVQDAIEGFFGHKSTRLVWGHGDKYYNRRFSKWILSFNREKEFGDALKALGIDASNQAKRKSACRIYETASEAWANIMSAETCGGEELEYVKKYLPNAYKALIDIIGKAE